MASASVSLAWIRQVASEASFTTDGSKCSLAVDLADAFQLVGHKCEERAANSCSLKDCIRAVKILSAETALPPGLRQGG